MEKQKDLKIEIDQMANQIIQEKHEKTESLLKELAGDRILKVKHYSQPSHNIEWFELDSNIILGIILKRKGLTMEYEFIKNPKGEWLWQNI